MELRFLTSFRNSSGTEWGAVLQHFLLCSVCVCECLEHIVYLVTFCDLALQLMCGPELNRVVIQISSSRVSKRATHLSMHSFGLILQRNRNHCIIFLVPKLPFVLVLQHVLKPFTENETRTRKIDSCLLIRNRRQGWLFIEQLTKLCV